MREKKDNEQVSTERSEAEELLVREYYYHSLRAEEIKIFLRGCGISVANE